MSNLSLILVLLLVMALGYQFGLVRSRNVAKSQLNVHMHSRSHHYGMLVALWAALPAFIILLLWLWLAPTVINSMLLSAVPIDVTSLKADELRVMLQRISNLAGNFGVVADAEPWERAAADHLRQLKANSTIVLSALMAVIVAIGMLVSLYSITPKLKARQQIERVVKVLLILCSAVAVLTTIGIVLSMVGETLKFFSYIPPTEFFFGTSWNPRFSTVGTQQQGSFGLLPLLAGTTLIAGIAMLVAIPLGLMVAVYLAEYASLRFRNIAKPLIEVLAGIPTIVYGFFALVSVGPFLRDLGATLGLNINATSALTAGVVMGIMIIPFISSLSDDILTQVPKAMRDGSLGLGATKSETILKVVLPAALPGIVGAVLLAASRAIGETMIVVLAAGNSPALTANPFEAVSTVTVTIVNQLTGDNDFSSPQSLVAFALGLTLFVITLLLNVMALVIVRKYREQYE